MVANTKPPNPEHWHIAGSSLAMKLAGDTISFIYCFPDGPEIKLRAAVETLPNSIFHIKEIRPLGRDGGSTLPPIQIKKVKGCWVHIDSGKETALSSVVGRAIEAKSNDNSL